MTVVVTAGPAWEPVDGMRRLTNASTGELGRVLAEAFSRAGHRVLLFRGEASTAALPSPSARVEVIPFGTNDSLAAGLARVAEEPGEAVRAVFHAAALCDYRVARVLDAAGADLGAGSRKVPSRAGAIRLELEPATKVLPRLPVWFPAARVVGWKYELDGDRGAALAAAWRQLAEAGTGACVVNGAAWGGGFGFCEPPDRVTPCADAGALAALLVRWLG